MRHEDKLQQAYTDLLNEAGPLVFLLDSAHPGHFVNGVDHEQLAGHVERLRKPIADVWRARGQGKMANRYDPPKPDPVIEERRDPRDQSIETTSLETVKRINDWQRNGKPLPRGIRMNNPGNLKELPGDKTQWLGERATDDDPIFEEFTSPVFGLRALAIVLLNYQRKHDLQTIREIITRWAPPEENNTEAYITDVCACCGVGPNLRYFAGNSDQQDHALQLLMAAIVKHENGFAPYGNTEYAEAVALARRALA